MRMYEDAMPTPCANCNEIVDFRDLVNDPLEEYDMICEQCREQRTEIEKDARGASA